MRHYFVVTAVLISAGLISSAIVEIYYRYQDNWDQHRRLQQEIVNVAAFKIEQYVREVERTMKTATRGPGLTEEGLSSEYQLQLEKLLVFAPAINSAVAFDTHKLQRAAVSRLEPVLPDFRMNPRPEAFQEARQGKTYFGPVYFVRDSEPFLTIAVPIERFAGAVIGVLQAEVDLKYVWEIISTIAVGKGGYAYIVTRSGDLIAHPELALVLQRKNLAHLNQVTRAFQPGSGQLAAITARNLKGKSVLSSHAPISALNWVVFTEQPVDEVYAPLYASILRSSVLLMMGLGVALLATLYVGHKVVRPLETLRRGVQRIGAGELNARIEVKTEDEMEVLADEFNKMTVKLKEAYSGLEQKVAERTRALTIANQRLADASMYKSQFLANVNHELRTPVSAIISSARLLLRKTEGQISAVQKDLLQDLLSSAEKLLVLVNGLLDLSKIEAGRMELHVEPVKLDSLIDDAVSTVEPMLNDGRVRLRRLVTPATLTWNTDREKLKQILVNLLSNAVKFTKEGEVRISASRQNGSLRLVVSDTGIGIAKGDLDHIFEEFRQASKLTQTNYGGTGLGLAITKKFASFLGGDIQVDSEVSKGSSFTVMLPLDPNGSMQGRTEER